MKVLVDSVGIKSVDIILYMHTVSVDAGECTHTVHYFPIKWGSLFHLLSVNNNAHVHVCIRVHSW